MIRVERPSALSPRDSTNFTIDLNIPSSIGVNIGVWMLVAAESAAEVETAIRSGRRHSKTGADLSRLLPEC
jgi:hypothetical protein